MFSSGLNELTQSATICASPLCSCITLRMRICARCLPGWRGKVGRLSRASHAATDCRISAVVWSRFSDRMPSRERMRSRVLPLASQERKYRPLGPATIKHGCSRNIARSPFCIASLPRARAHSRTRSPPHMATDADALVIGGGPAGASAAILLAKAGWRVILAEQQVYPRQKVCGECLTPASFALLDELGVGPVVRDNAGPELQRVGWMSSSPTIVADLPPCTDGPYRFGRALGRDQLDAILLGRARALGVEILQPAKVRSLRGDQGRFDCMIEAIGDRHSHEVTHVCTSFSIRVSIVIDGHGSWEGDPDQRQDRRVSRAHAPRFSSDLFGFKASFRRATLPRGLLPVLSFKGGYGGMVV